MTYKCVITTDCDLCYDCVDICPEVALTTTCRGEIIYLPDECSYCEVCMDICPQEAIKIMEADE